MVSSVKRPSINWESVKQTVVILKANEVLHFVQSGAVLKQKKQEQISDKVSHNSQLMPLSTTLLKNLCSVQKNAYLFHGVMA